MHTSTDSYVHLQKLYKARAEEEKDMFKEILKKESGGDDIDADTVDSFLKNCHALKVLKGKKWGVLDADQEALGGYRFFHRYYPVDPFTTFYMQHWLFKHIRRKRQPTWLCLPSRVSQLTSLLLKSPCVRLSRISLGKT